MKQNKLTFYIFLLISIITFGNFSNIMAEPKTTVFSTWEGFEVDKCAVIWLIQRFIDKNAVIKFFPKGEIISEGIPFDTPDAQLRRYQSMSTFEFMLKHYNLQDPKLVYIGKIIHDIEINIWEKKALEETPMAQDTINNIIRNSKNSDEIIEKSSRYFDLLFMNSSKNTHFH